MREVIPIFGISRSEIAERIKTHLLDELAKNGEVQVQGVGTLKQLPDGGLKFYPNQDFINALHRKQRVVRA